MDSMLNETIQLGRMQVAMAMLWADLAYYNTDDEAMVFDAYFKLQKSESDLKQAA